MIDAEGVIIDIGGPLRVSDIEMKEAEDRAYEAQYGYPIDMSPMDAWQLYGMRSAKRYTGVISAALAIERSGRSYSDFLGEADPVAAIEAAIGECVPEKEREVIEAVAKEAEEWYNDHQSKRLAEGAKEALDILKSRETPSAIVTSVFTDKAQEWTKETLPGYFDPKLVFGVEPDTPRDYDPKPEQLRNCAERMGIEPASLLYVGDTRGDMKASMEAGVMMALIRKGMTPPALFPGYLEEMSYFKPGENFFEVDDLLEAVKSLE
jgi:phosphoglycolate phosphatase-like HAD superfamily hydrolase